MQHALAPIDEIDFGPISFSVGGGLQALHPLAAAQKIQFNTTTELAWVVPPEVRWLETRDHDQTC